MRTLLGPAAQAIQRRGLALERAALLTLRRDAYATPPGPTLGLAIGERTTYRPGAWLFETFERDALGDTYAAWGGAAGLTLGAGGVTAAVGPVGMVTHPRGLPRDAWAALQIGALSGDAAVGLLLRAADTTADGYWITATPTLTVIERLDAGGATGLASVATPWRAGEMLRAVWAWDQLRVYRDTILVAQVTDASRLVAGRAGFTARRGDGAAQAAITAFLGGEARQEWLGAGLDLGDVERALGEPARFDLAFSNLAPMGGADRFAALLRHGLNTTDTYDLDRGEVRVLTSVDGLAPPLTAGIGWIDGPAEVTEDRVRLACRGRDAFLTPRLEAGVVTYLAGPPPGGLTPLPPEPCAPSTPPEIMPGSPPAEPVDPATEDGVGPEAPPAPPRPPLLGLWMILMGYRLDEDENETPYAPGGTTVTAWVMTGPTAGGAHSVDLIQTHAPAPTASEAARQLMLWMYRGPDIVGTHLSVPTAAHGGYPGLTLQLLRTSSTGEAPGVPLPPGGFPALTLRVVDYSGAGISTVADLQAFQPGRLIPGHLPLRVQTLATFTFPAQTIPGGITPNLVQTLDVALDAIPLTRFTGPQIIGLEFEPIFAGAVDTADAQTTVQVRAYYAAGAVNYQGKSVHPEAFS